MNTSPMTAMAATLARRPGRRDAEAEEGTTKVGRMRRALEDGPKSGPELASIADLPSAAFVVPLLKHDLARRRVVRHGEFYELNPDWDDGIDDAITLLRRHGFTVTAPKPRTH